VTDGPVVRSLGTGTAVPAWSVEPGQWVRRPGQRRIMLCRSVDRSLSDETVMLGFGGKPVEMDGHEVVLVWAR